MSRRLPSCAATAAALAALPATADAHRATCKRDQEPGREDRAAGGLHGSAGDQPQQAGRTPTGSTSVDGHRTGLGVHLRRLAAARSSGRSRRGRGSSTPTANGAQPGA